VFHNRLGKIKFKKNRFLLRMNSISPHKVIDFSIFSGGSAEKNATFIPIQSIQIPKTYFFQRFQQSFL
jgi:hypothetical protein